MVGCQQSHLHYQLSNSSTPAESSLMLQNFDRHRPGAVWRQVELATCLGA